MDLSEILKKTKKRSEKIPNKRKYPSIAMEERPYSIEPDVDESDNNQITIGSHLDNNQITVREPIRSQSDNNQITIRSHLDNNQITIRKPIRSHNITPIRSQLDNNVSVHLSPLDKIKRLSGLMKKAFYLIVEQCCNMGELKTGPISNEFFQSALKTDKNSIKTILKRVVDTSLVYREAGKPGKGGFTEFSITPEVRNAAIQYQKSEGFRSQLDNKNDIELDNNKITIREPIRSQSPPSSSSNINNININKTTTTGPVDNFEAGEDEWSDVVIPQDVLALGFDKKKIEGIKKLSVNSPGVVQRSLNALAFDITQGKAPKTREGLLATLIGILRKGDEYTSEAFNRHLKQKAEQAKERLKEEIELNDLLEKQRFLDWHNSQRPEEIVRMISDVEIQKAYRQKGLKSALAYSYLKTHYKQQAETD